MSWAFESCFREGVVEKARDVRIGVNGCLDVADVNDVVIRQLAQMKGARELCGPEAKARAARRAIFDRMMSFGVV